MSYDLDLQGASLDNLIARMQQRTGPLYHGGVPGLSAGDLLEPGHSRDHNHPGCQWCEARANGGTLGGLGGDGPSERHAVYVTTDRAYARFHASLFGHGDLYEVEPVGELVHSDEDPVPSWTCQAARVVLVVQRAVLLTMRQRWDHYWDWAKREGVTKAQARLEFEGMLGGKWPGYGQGKAP